MNSVLISAMTIDKEEIEIWQHGVNDFEIFYKTSDASVRGGLLQVMQDLNNCFGIFD